VAKEAAVVKIASPT
jgi:hypothetical protein